MVEGGLRFALVSLAAFAVWAFAGRWYRTHGGEPAMYASIAMVFLCYSGFLMHPLMRGPRRLIRFYRLFVPAFFAYALLWSGFWFWLKQGVGEWLGALTGCFAFVWISLRLGGVRRFDACLFGIFLVAHTLGYYAGGETMAWCLERSREAMEGGFTKGQWVVLAKLSWGLFYGIGFGAGMGAVYDRVRVGELSAA